MVVCGGKGEVGGRYTMVIVVVVVVVVGGDISCVYIDITICVRKR